MRDLTNSFAEPAVAVVTGDPVCRGFQGQEYQVHGVPGMVYNVLVARDVVVNARLGLIREGEALRWHSMKVARLTHDRLRLRLQRLGSTVNASHAHPLPMTKAWTHTGTYLSEVGVLIAHHRASVSVFLRTGGYPFAVQGAMLNGHRWRWGWRVCSAPT